MRIADRALTDSVRANLNANNERLLKVQRELSSGRRINAPSDDPAGAAMSLRHRTDIALSEQYSRTVDSASSRLGAADSALGSLTDVLQRARELTVQAGSAAISPSQLSSIGTEINQILHQAVQIGNTNFGGQYIFAGTKSTTSPFTAAGDTPATVTYNGNANPITLGLGQGAQVQVDVPGDQAILPAMNALIQIRDALNAGDRTAATTAGLPALDAAMDAVSQTRGTVGARVNRLESLGQQIDSDRINLQGLQSQIEDIDVADTIVRLNASMNVYQAALGAAAKAIQPSLAEFLH
jgi:flagellar hook-associated protein 3 FlgL